MHVHHVRPSQAYMMYCMIKSVKVYSLRSFGLDNTVLVVNHLQEKTVVHINITASTGLDLSCDPWYKSHLEHCTCKNPMFEKREI